MSSVLYDNISTNEPIVAFFVCVCVCMCVMNDNQREFTESVPFMLIQSVDSFIDFILSHGVML